ncbi:MAG: hypothetical protein HYT08_01825 [Candidatus Levybacteria bacterium]|nr:hypothetical protein [Candidatus Levybacteria bacterium]
MSRHKKKTRKQKVLADLHRKMQSLETHSSIALNEEKKIKSSEVPRIKPQTTVTYRPLAINTYPFLLKDISRTGILTAIILAFQIILLFLLKNHIISLQGISY